MLKQAPSEPKGSGSDKFLILFEFNEINFNIVRGYLEAAPDSDYPGFRRLLSLRHIDTYGENDYSDIEPWIHWVNVHTGLRRSIHGVFRLGDIVDKSDTQIFELVESAGYRVGAVSPMNARNELKRPAYFIPDPWTKTEPDGSRLSKLLTSAIRQVVGDNARGRITVKSLVTILYHLLVSSYLKNWPRYLSLALQSLKHHWARAVLFDLLISDVHLRLYRKEHPNFAVLFLNGAAHIQHHYFFNSTVLRLNNNQRNPEWYIRGDIDPVKEMLRTYDQILGNLFDLGGQLVVANGLTQVPYDRTKYYYRLKDHKVFLGRLGIACTDITPLMTRDFIMHFCDQAGAVRSVDILSSLTVQRTGLPLFGEIENRGTSVFVTLTYPELIVKDDYFLFESVSFPLFDEVVFVAVKNGKHISAGDLFATSGIRICDSQSPMDISDVYDHIRKFFGIDGDK